jgi:hypothetical protein
MKKLLVGLILAAASGLASAADVGVSIRIGDPNFYGVIDIGEAPPPRLIYAQPMIVNQPVVVVREPLYLHVPPGHAKHWDKHCAEYGACGRRVYFVEDNWYETVYAPRYREVHWKHDDHDDHGDHGDHDKGHGKGKGKGKGKH